MGLEHLVYLESHGAGVTTGIRGSEIENWALETKSKLKEDA